MEWYQVRPDEVIFNKRGEATKILSRAGAGINPDAAAKAGFRIPFGHPEGYYVAEANIYRAFINAVMKRRDGEELTEADLDFPDVNTGVSGVKFVHAVIESGDSDSRWVEIKE